jgi:hypothetical protein
MNTDTANKIVADPSLVANLATTMRSVVEWSRKKDVYDDLFLAKKSVNFREADLSCEIDLLLDAELLEFDQAESVISSNVMVHVDPHLNLTPELEPMSGVFLMTDWPDKSPEDTVLFDGRDMVFPLHYESFTVVRELKELLEAEVPPRNVLDMFAGSGVLGIYAYKMGVPDVTFCDVSVRSIAFCRLNACMSGIEDASFVVSDCFNSVRSGTDFSLVLANPPFEPVLEEDRERYYRHSYGGPSGQEVMHRFLGTLPEHMADDGCLIAVDFLPSDSTRAAIDAHRNQMQALHPEIAQASLRLRCYDDVPFQDFWLRYDALGLDSKHTLETEYQGNSTIKGFNTLVLATVTLKRRSANTGEINNTAADGPPILYEEVPPPSPWWNPIHWPLPCGVGVDPKNVELWFSLWSQHEYEIRSDSSALYAESFASAPDTGIEHIDFNDWIFGDKGSLIPEHFANALRSTVLDIRNLSIGSISLPDTVSLFLLPQNHEDDAQCVRIKAPSFPVRVKKSRRELLNDPEAIPIDQVSLRDVTVEFSRIASKKTSLAFFFSISNPVAQGHSLLDVPQYAYQGPGIPYVGRHVLAWNGKHYEPPSYVSKKFEYGFVIRGDEYDVQRYLLVLELPEFGLETLERLEGLVNRRWQEFVSIQLFDVMRDQLTLMAIPLVLGQQIALQVSLKEKVVERERLIAYASHTIFAPVQDAIRLLDRAKERPNNEKLLELARSRILTLERNARTVVDVMKAEMGQLRLEDVDIHTDILVPVVAEISESRKLTELPNIPIALDAGEETFQFKTDHGIVSVVVNALIQNAIDHIDKTVSEGVTGCSNNIHIGLHKSNGKLILEVDNGGSPVSHADILNLNQKLNAGSVEPWGVTLKGSKHYGIGTRKIKSLLQYLDATINYEKKGERYSAVVAFPTGQPKSGASL